MSKVVPINISATARSKTNRLLSVNDIRENLWNFDAPLYLDDDSYHLMTPDDVVVIFKIDLEPHFRVAVVTQTHPHADYEESEKFERKRNYKNAWEVAHHVRGG